MRSKHCKYFSAGEEDGLFVSNDIDSSWLSGISSDEFAFVFTNGAYFISLLLVISFFYWFLLFAGIEGGK